MPRIGTTGMKGVRNGRCISGCVRRITITAAHTTTKAISVPMFTRSARSFSGKSAPTRPTKMPVTMVARCGVRKRGWTAPKKLRGMSPSRAIANRMRAWLSMRTSSTLVIPTTAPAEISRCATPSPRAANASATGASRSISWYGTMPVSTAATRM